MIVASPLDFRDLARRRLPHFLFEYIDGGAYDEVSLARNISDLARVELKQSVLKNVSDIDLSADILGKKYALPIALGPIGLAGMNARRGECQAARAANKADIPFTLSTVSACSINEVAQAVSEPFWFQLYMLRDRAFMKDLIAQAQAAKCKVLVFTVDMPLPGTRYRDHRSGLSGAPGMRGQIRRILQGTMRPRWAWDVGVRGRPHTLGNVEPVLRGKTGIEDFLGWMSNNFDSSVTWQDLDFVRAHWKGPILIKGIMTPEDAITAVESGADGVIVSNHGGRQLDGVPSTVQALPSIVDALNGSSCIMVDGGVRSGLDIIRMLALGADGVLVGRLWAWALGADGEGGVTRVIELLKAEMQVAMALTGVTRIGDVNNKILIGN